MIEVELCTRHFGIHTPTRKVVVDLSYVDLVYEDEAGERHMVPGAEKLLLSALGSGFLDERIAQRTLLILEDTAVREPELFRPWEKYCDSLSLFIRPLETP